MARNDVSRFVDSTVGVFLTPRKQERSADSAAEEKDKKKKNRPRHQKKTNAGEDFRPLEISDVSSFSFNASILPSYFLRLVAAAEQPLVDTP